MPIISLFTLVEDQTFGPDYTTNRDNCQFTTPALGGNSFRSALSELFISYINLTLISYKHSTSVQAPFMSLWVEILVTSKYPPSIATLFIIHRWPLYFSFSMDTAMTSLSRWLEGVSKSNPLVRKFDRFSSYG